VRKTSAVLATLSLAVLALTGCTAAPTFDGRRGNPVAFDAAHRDDLLALEGDQGARRLLISHPVTTIAVPDPGILRDIDSPSDLPA